MTTKTETGHAGGFILSEAEGSRARENVTIDTGTLVAGTVLGKITASGKYVQMTLGGSDGSQNAAGVLLADADASVADVQAVAIVRDAEVNTNELVWPNGASAGDKTAGIAKLVALGVIVR